MYKIGGLNFSARQFVEIVGAETREEVDLMLEKTFGWLTIEEAKEKLFLPHQIWAVDQILIKKNLEHKHKKITWE